MYATLVAHQMSIPLRVTGTISNASPTVRVKYNDGGIKLNQNKQYEIALVGGYIPFSWTNVIPGVNDTMKISNDDGVTWVTVTVPEGLYGVNDIASVLYSKQQETVGFLIKGGATVDQSDDIVGIDMKYNPSMMKTSIYIYYDSTQPALKYKIDLDKMRDMLGFSEAQQIVSAAASYTYSASIPKVEGKYEYYKITCDLCAPQLLTDGSSEIVLYADSPYASPGGIQTLPQNTIIDWVPMNSNVTSIKDFKVGVTDQDGAVLDLRKQKFFFNIRVREVSA